MHPRTNRAFATQLLLSALLFLGAGGALGFAIVDIRQDISRSANTARLNDQRVIDLERRIAALGGAIATQQSPDSLARRNQELALGLVPPAESQLVRVEASPTTLLAAKRNAEIFAAERGLSLPPIRFQLGNGAPR